MKIAIFPYGSRGDIQPYLALAVGLQQAGHHVTLAASRNFAEWILSYGVHVHPVRFDMQEFIQRPESRAIMTSKNVFQIVRMSREQITPGTVSALEDFWQAAQDADFVIQTGTGHGSVEVATQRGIPMAFAYLLPVFVPTRAFPSFFLQFRNSLGGGYNKLTHHLMERFMWSILGGATNQWRKNRLKLPPWRSFDHMHQSREKFGTPWLFPISPSVLPKPEEWKPFHHITGYWFLDTTSDWQPPADLVRFLESGPPPVYIGFGSMTREDPEHQTRLILRALELAGQRGILLTGWGGLAQQTATENVFYIENVPHEWLFPKMAAVIHHGGAGSTAAGLRAGIPGVAVPFLGDQYAWADLLVNLGVGPRLTDIKKLTAEKLAEGIQVAVNDPSMRAGAVALGEKIRAEDGVARAIEIIEKHATEFKRNNP